MIYIYGTPLVQRGGSKWEMVILEAGPMMEIVVFRMR